MIVYSAGSRVKYFFQTEHGDISFGVREVDDGGSFVREIVPEVCFTRGRWLMGVCWSAVPEYPVPVCDRCVLTLIKALSRAHSRC